MKRFKLGAFLIMTVLLLLSSMSTSVTAATFTETIVDLESEVTLGSASVSITPRNVWSYSGWTWVLDVNDGDNVQIRTYCEWSNGQPGTGTTGEHYFYMEATYGDVPTVYDDDKIVYSQHDESGWWHLSITVLDVDEDTEIDLYWYVEAKNKEWPFPSDSNDQTGTIYLI